MRTHDHLIPGLPHAEHQPHRRRRRWVGRSVLAVLAVAVLVGGYQGVRGMIDNFGPPTCRAVALGQMVTFSPEQTGNAATIAAIAVRRGLPARAATIAIATAIQESKLRNIEFGDRDSVGLFQQRPSQGWGTAKQLTDPVYATNAFYDALVKINGYETMEITKVAQRVQRSANPEAYADHEQQGRILASTLAGQSPGGMGCRLDDAKSSTAPAAVIAALTAELGATGRSDAKRITVNARSAEQAWAAGSWAVAHAETHGITSVTVGDRTWTRSRDKAAWSWQPADSAAPATAVVITLA